MGAGAGPNFTGHEQAQRTFKQTAGVVEGRPGIIESTNIDPLNENSNKGSSMSTVLFTRGSMMLTWSSLIYADDGWANATREPGSTTASSTGIVNNAMDVASGAATVAGGAARMAYGHAVGDEALKAAGKEQVYGKQ